MFFVFVTTRNVVQGEKKTIGCRLPHLSANKANTAGDAICASTFVRRKNTGSQHDANFVFTGRAGFQPSSEARKISCDNLCASFGFERQKSTLCVARDG